MDYLVEKRKKESIHQVALDLRQKYNQTQPYLNILEFLDILMKDNVFTYHVLNNTEWEQEFLDLEAFSQVHTQEIFFPEKLIAKIEDHDFTRARFTLAHEIGHVLLHQDETQDIVFDKDDPSHLQVNSSEWQANYFAGALLAPNEYVLTCNTHQELIDLCRISWQASNVRFKQCNMDIPPLYNEKQPTK